MVRVEQRDFPNTLRFTEDDSATSNVIEIPDIGCSWSVKCNANEYSFAFILQISPEMLARAKRYQFCVTAKILVPRVSSEPLAPYDSGWQTFKDVSTILKHHAPGYSGYNQTVNAKLSLKPVAYSETYIAKPEADIPSMFGNEKYSDFLFVVGKKQFKVHKNVVGFASEVFDKIFTSEMEEKNKNQCKVVDMQPDMFEHLLRFIYGLGLPKNLEGIAMKLFEAAHYYGIKSLTEICSNEILLTLSKENAVEIFEWADLYDELELKMEAWTIIKRDILEIEYEMEGEPLPTSVVQRLVEDKKFVQSFKKIQIKT